MDFISKHSTTILLIAFGIAGAALIWFSTPWGIGVGYDSIFYLSAADNLLLGNGLSRLDGYGTPIPLTHFPPFYPISVAGLSVITGLETDAAARIIAAGLFGGLVFLTGWLVNHYTRSSLASVLAAALILVSPVLVDVSFMAMSESLYLMALLLMMHVLNKYLSKETIWYLITASVLGAVVYLTRYVGITAIALGVTALLTLGSKTFGKRMKDAIIFGVIGVLPMLVFYSRNWYLTGSFTNRVLIFHPPTEAQFRQGINTLSAWLLPIRFNAGIRAIVLVTLIVTFLILIVMMFLRRRKRSWEQIDDNTPRQFIVLLLIYAVIYIASLGLSLTFFDASTRLNDRILSPLYVIGIIIGFIALWSSPYIRNYSWIKIVVTLICVAFIAINLLRGVGVVNNMRATGKGFSGRAWRSSEIIANLRRLPISTMIYSNEAFAVYYLTGRSVNWIPENYDPVKSQQAQNYAERIDGMRGEIIEHDGALVIFNSMLKTNVYAPIEELASGLTLWAQGEDGSVYIAPQ